MISLFKSTKCKSCLLRFIAGSILLFVPTVCIQYLSINKLSAQIAKTALNLNKNASIPLDPDVRTGKLPNGMTYYVKKNKFPEKRAELRLALNAGSLLETDAQQGLAHFTEHMCFNGTKNFPKNSLIDFVELIGTKFGPHLNAYTSFDETVYMLRVRTDSSGILEKGLTILEEWAHNVSMEGSEIDKERGVVIEEWRLRLGAQNRMREKTFPVMFHGSKYVDRLPIGKKEILEKFEHQTIKDFYRDWYRPDLMAIIAVGDFDLEAVEKLIKTQFGSIPSHSNPKPRVSFDIPLHNAPLAVVVTDKEATNCVIQIMNKREKQKTTTVEDYLTEVKKILIGQILNTRLSEISHQNDAPFAMAYGYVSPLGRNLEAMTMLSICDEKKIKIATQTILQEMERVAKFGFNQAELDRAKSDLFTEFESRYNERDKSESDDMAMEFVQHFLSQSPTPGIEFDYLFAKQYLSDITLNSINPLASELMADKSRVLVVMAPDKPTISLPTEAELLTMNTTAKSTKLDAVKDENLDFPLLPKEPIAGKILTETPPGDPKTTPGFTQWILSNGAKVLIKPTTFKNDEILFRAVSLGGSSQVKDADFLSAQFATDLVDWCGLGQFNPNQLMKKLAGKKMYITTSLSEEYESISGSSSIKDFEEFLRLLYAQITLPRKSEPDYKNFIDRQKSLLINKSASPEGVFYDSVSVTFGNNHFRRKPITVERLSEIDYNKALEIYQQRFVNAADFTFIFVGNIDFVKHKPLIEKYIGGLPVTGPKEDWKDVGIRAPKGVVTKTVKKGKEAKSSVMIRFESPMKITSENKLQFSLMADILAIKLRENMRETQGGVYGVGVNAVSTKFPIEKATLTVRFGCSPQNVDKLVSTVFEEIVKLKSQGVEEKDLKKVTETMIRSIETESMENKFWVSWAANSIIQKEELKGTVAERIGKINAVTSSELQKIAKEHINESNHAKVILLPEN